MLRSKTIKDADPVVREAESDSDCLADRAVALDDQKVSICEERSKYPKDLQLYSCRTVLKRFMYQNVQLTVVISVCNVIDRLVTVGAFTKTPGKIYQERRSKTVDQIV